MVKKKEIRDSLLEQLEQKGALQPQFIEQVNTAVFLFETIGKMKRNIKKKGTTYMAVSAVGKEYEKDNPDVKALPNYQRQLQALLKDLGLTTENVINEIDPESDLL